MIKTLTSRHNQVFRTLLRKQRIGKRLRQQDLAALLGRGQGTVSKVERGERRIDVLELRDWLKAMNVDFVRFARELDKSLDALPAIEARLFSHARDAAPDETAPEEMRTLSGAL